jgi:hypothetical protein
MRKHFRLFNKPIAIIDATTTTTTTNMTIIIIIIITTIVIIIIIIIALFNSKPLYLTIQVLLL